jgi:hypothetical protein
VGGTYVVQIQIFTFTLVYLTSPDAFTYFSRFIRATRLRSVYSNLIADLLGMSIIAFLSLGGIFAERRMLNSPYIDLRAEKGNLEDILSAGKIRMWANLTHAHRLAKYET